MTDLFEEHHANLNAANYLRVRRPFHSIHDPTAFHPEDLDFLDRATSRDLTEASRIILNSANDGLI